MCSRKKRCQRAAVYTQRRLHPSTPAHMHIGAHSVEAPWSLAPEPGVLELSERDTSGVPHVLVGVVERSADAFASLGIGYSAEGGDCGSAD